MNSHCESVAVHWFRFKEQLIFWKNISFLFLQKSKDKFVNQPHPIKIVKIKAFFVFLKQTLWKNSKFQYWFLKMLINLYLLSYFLIKLKLGKLQYVKTWKKSICKFHFPVNNTKCIFFILIYKKYYWKSTIQVFNHNMWNTKKT